MKKGTTGHPESVQVTFDPSKISYDEILRLFFRVHDPTQLSRQMNDHGTQCRSPIFFHGDAQRGVAGRVKHEIDASGKWPRPVATEIVPASTFYHAEVYHQDYLKTPWGYNCHPVRDREAHFVSDAEHLREARSFHSMKRRVNK